MTQSRNQLIQAITEEYLSEYKLLPSTNKPNLQVIQQVILKRIETQFIITCSNKSAANKWKIPTELTFAQIALIINRLYKVRTISCAGHASDPSYDILAIYHFSGEKAGLYVPVDKLLFNEACKLDFGMTTRKFAEVKNRLSNISKRVSRTIDRDLVAVNNGIFNYKTKELLPFSPEMVFLNKSRVDYNPYATNVTLLEPYDIADWNVEDWMATLSDDHEVVQLLWQILGAIIRPNVSWNKSAWLYSEKGNNGKGTLCELMRNLCGAGAHTSIALGDFSKDFYLESLVWATAIITDENDVGLYLDKVANLKAIITGDVIHVNRKYKSTVALQYKGFMVQCLNGLPKVKDRSDSFYRRQLFVPMTKNFQGVERKCIKDVYLKDKNVLEYVLHKVLNSDFYELNEPKSSKAVLNDYKESNDPVRSFFTEVSNQLVWDLIPFTFLYDLYRAWVQKYNPSGQPQNHRNFINDILQIIHDDDIWYCEDKSKNITSNGRMSAYEPLIAEYNLTSWMNPYSYSASLKDRCTPNLKPTYRGLKRRHPSPNNTI